ncbi:hypothetical protein [Clostridium sp.]|uniref:hypothetical protein n=1 Tax=Clostridium sp. TaxID=1506 RepID=UPI001B442DEE|nr:hypothetical protein [Clostridium sp.]MBP3915675.1 hypothetical protein [Clostridium sp.]
MDIISGPIELAKNIMLAPFKITKNCIKIYAKVKGYDRISSINTAKAVKAAAVQNNANTVNKTKENIKMKENIKEKSAQIQRILNLKEEIERAKLEKKDLERKAEEFIKKNKGKQQDKEIDKIKETKVKEDKTRYKIRHERINEGKEERS